MADATGRGRAFVVGIRPITVTASNPQEAANQAAELLLERARRGEITVRDTETDTRTPVDIDF